MDSDKYKVYLIYTEYVIEYGHALEMLFLIKVTE